MHKFKPGDRVKVNHGNGAKEITRIAELLVLNGEPYYTVITRGNFPIPESVLEPAPEPDDDSDDLIMLFDEIEVGEIAVEYMFELGDIVRVHGYGRQLFKIIARRTEIEERAGEQEYEVSYMVAPYGVTPTPWNVLEVFEEDVELISKDANQNVPSLAVSSERRGETVENAKQSSDDKRPKHREEEKRKLAALAKNRRMVERARAMIDDYLVLYYAFNDEKYIRKIERLMRFIDRVPCRAYEIE